MYTIKRLTRNTHYQIASFGDNKEPDHTYVVSIIGSRVHCTCQGFPKTPGISHKHVKMVKAWIAAGEPWLACIDIDTNSQVLITNHIPVEKIS